MFCFVFTVNVCVEFYVSTTTFMLTIVICSVEEYRYNEFSLTNDNRRSEGVACVIERKK